MTDDFSEEELDLPTSNLFTNAKGQLGAHCHIRTMSRDFPMFTFLLLVKWFPDSELNPCLNLSYGFVLLTCGNGGIGQMHSQAGVNSVFDNAVL